MSHNTRSPKVAAAMAAHYNKSAWNPDQWSILIDTDSYKVGMWKQYPPKTEYVSSYIEARGGDMPNTVFFGLQPFLQKLTRPIVKAEVEFAKTYWETQGQPFNYDGWMYIVDHLGGKLPLQIDAVDEGTVVPIHNALLRVTNTDPRCAWLPTWVETAMLRAIWYQTTVATLSWTIKRVIEKFLRKTTNDEEIAGILPFKLHDFGSRGASSYETAMLGGMAHLVNFMGSDTGPAVLGAITHYNAQFDPASGISPAYSIPAAEHSTITSWGEQHEVDAFRNMLATFGKKDAIIAVVSDSYDIYHATKNLWGGELREEVEQMGGTLVIRPDSGDPITVPVEVIEMLGESFGFSVNDKGYKVLPSCVRVIQGDGVALESITAILTLLTEKGWSAENITFGMGGALLQQPNRDTMHWAMKASAICIDGEWHDVFKSPIGDHAKKSKKGIQGLISECGLGSCSIRSKRVEDIFDGGDLLTSAFTNGQLVNPTTFDAVRHRAENWDKLAIVG